MPALAVVEPEDEEPDGTERDRELGARKAVREKLLEMFDDIDAGFTNQAERANAIMDHWDAYKCQLSSNQFYNGNSRIFMPIVSVAVQARSTRFANQLFPQSGRYVDVTTVNGDVPWATMALMEHYVRKAKARTKIVKPLIKNGDCEGQYSIYVDWKVSRRHVGRRKNRPVRDGGEEHPEYGDVEDFEEDETLEGHPTVEVLSDTDLLILPTTAQGIEDALDQGGSITVRRRWSKATIRKMIDAGDLMKPAGEAILEAMRQPDTPGRRDVQKKVAETAGIRIQSGGKFAMVYETWTKAVKVEGEHRLVRAYYGGDDIVMGCKLCPYWNDKCPVISVPVDQDAGVAKGRAPVADCLDLQIYANDLTNEAADVSHFAAMPIVIANPESNPKNLVLGLGAQWDASPSDIEFAQFPPLYKDLLSVIEACRQQIFQILGINPSMMPQSSGRPGAKRNQAEIAMEQAIDILTTADAVTVISEGVLDEMLQRFADYDHQFRDRPITVRAFGEFGRRANMEVVEPIQEGARYEYTWLGVEAARNAAAAQQQITFLSTLIKIPPELIKGYVLNLSAAIQQISLNQLGPRIAPLTIVSDKDQQSMDGHEENMMLSDGFDVQVHPADDDLEHIRVHMEGMKQHGDPAGLFKLHIGKHMMQRQAKATAAAQQQAQEGGGRGPQPGASPGPPRPVERVPGVIPQDQMARAGDPSMGPRRA